MTVRYYVAVVEASALKDGGYSVFFPDLDGCTSGGDTLEEAVRNAEEALALHLEGMISQGEAIPLPSAPEAVHVDADTIEAARILVRAALPTAPARDAAE